MAKNQTNKWLVGSLVGIGAIALLSKKKETVSGIGAMPGLVAGLTYDEVVGTIRRVARDLYDQIWKASNLTGVPTWLINAISAHEIRWKPYNTTNPVVGATGPMQLTAPTIFDTWHFAMKWNLVSPALEQYVKSVLGSKYDRFVKLAKDRGSDSSYSVFLKNPQFNVVMGGVLIRCLMYLCTEGSQLNLAKLVLGYNRGIGYAVKKLGNRDTYGISPDRLIGLAPSAESKKYIRNMIGSGGYLEHVRSEGM